MTEEQVKELYELVIMQYFDPVTGKYEVVQGSAGAINAALLLARGVATVAGTEATLIDGTKDFEAAVYAGKVIVITVGGIDYHRVILTSAGAVLGFASLLDPIGAAAAVGSGEDAEGLAVFRCKGDLMGAVGNDYSIRIVQGEATTGDDVVTFDPDTKVLTITVNLTASSEPRTLAAGSVGALLAGTAGVSDLFEVDVTFTAGNLPIGGDPIPFVGGADGVTVPKGAPYEIRA